jgi:hypothetical protein
VLGEVSLAVALEAPPLQPVHSATTIGIKHLIDAANGNIRAACNPKNRLQTGRETCRSVPRHGGGVR